MKNIIKEILFWTWCLPQTLLGLFLKLIFKGKKYRIWYCGKYITYYKYNYKSGSISLGKYLLICSGHKYSNNVIKHELGHQIQSFILGPLYLLIIGLPSLLWGNIFWKPEKHNYYSFYTEKWANKLGFKEFNNLEVSNNE